MRGGKNNNGKETTIRKNKMAKAQNHGSIIIESLLGTLTKQVLRQGKDLKAAKDAGKADNLDGMLGNVKLVQAMAKAAILTTAAILDNARGATAE
jgi:hypothetical protein